MLTEMLPNEGGKSYVNITAGVVYG